MTRAFRRRAACILALTLIVGGCAGTAQPSAALDSVTLRLDWLSLGNNSMYYLGVDKGFYLDENIVVRIGEGRGSVSTSQIVGTGSDMFGIADVASAASVADQGAEITALAAFVRTSTVAITVLKDSGIQTPEDLRGKRIGAPPFSFATIFLPAFLEANGMTEADVEIISVDPAATAQALVDGRVDGIADLTNANAPIVEIRLEREVTTLPYAESGVNALSTGLIVNNAVIESNPDLVTRFVRATVRSWEYARENPDELVAATLDRDAQGNADVTKRQFEKTIENVDTPNTAGVPFGWMTDADIEQTVSLVRQFLDLSDGFDASAFFVNDYLPQ